MTGERNPDWKTSDQTLFADDVVLYTQKILKTLPGSHKQNETQPTD